MIQVPDFGNRFWVYALYDGRTDEFAQIGKQYDTKPGFYLMVGPNWKGKKRRQTSPLWCVLHAICVRSSPYLYGRYARGSRCDPTGDQADQLLPALTVLREDEDLRLEQAAPLSGSGIERQR